MVKSSVNISNLRNILLQCGFSAICFYCSDFYEPLPSMKLTFLWTFDMFWRCLVNVHQFQFHYFAYNYSNRYPWYWLTLITMRIMWQDTKANLVGFLLALIFYVIIFYHSLLNMLFVTDLSAHDLQRQCGMTSWCAVEYDICHGFSPTSVILHYIFVWWIPLSQTNMYLLQSRKGSCHSLTILCAHGIVNCVNDSTNPVARRTSYRTKI